jgi:uncharacterized protein YceK
MSVINWAERKTVGDAHELRVRGELEQRGYTVSPYGQGVLAEPIRRALKMTDSSMRWDPDMVAACGSFICLIDAKTAMRGEEAHRYTISRKALSAHLRMSAMLDLPIYYVFSNLGVATAVEVMQHCGLARIGQTGGYVSLPASAPLPFDEVFGAPQAATLAALKIAA